jgi:hypothetical protein
MTQKVPARTVFARQTARVAKNAIAADMYPQEDVERYFGIKMSQLSSYGNVKDYPPGQLMLGAWRSLFLHGKLNRYRIAAALAEDRLQEYFESKIRANAMLSYYTLELVERNFAGVEWELLPRTPNDNALWDEGPLPLEPHDRIVVRGLVSAKGMLLNGRHGMVVGKDKERYQVRVAGTREPIRLKPENVVIRDNCEGPEPDFSGSEFDDPDSDSDE